MSSGALDTGLRPVPLPDRARSATGSPEARDPLGELEARGRRWAAAGAPLGSDEGVATEFALALAAAVEAVDHAGPVFWRGTADPDEWARMRLGAAPALEAWPTRAHVAASGAPYGYRVRGDAANSARSGQVVVTGFNVCSPLYTITELFLLPAHVDGGRDALLADVSYRVRISTERLEALLDWYAQKPG